MKVLQKSYLLPLAIVTFMILLFLAAGSPPVLYLVKGQMIDLLKNRLNTHISISRIKGNLFYGIELHRIAISDAISIKKTEISYNPIKLLSKEIDITQLYIDSLKVDVQKTEEILRAITVVESDFTFRIRHLHITNTGFCSSINDQSLDASLVLEGQISKHEFLIDTLLISTENSHLAITGKVPIDTSSAFDLNLTGFLSIEDLSKMT